MRSNNLDRFYRRTRRKFLKARQSYDQFRDGIHDKLFGRPWVCWALLAVLLVVTATSVVRMARINSKAHPDRDMKWFLHQGNVQVAAPPLASEVNPSIIYTEAEEETAEETAEETETSASGAASAADVFSFLGFSARAEEAMETAPPMATYEPEPNQIAGADTGGAEEMFTFDWADDIPEPEPADAGDAPAASGSGMAILPEEPVLITISAVGDCTLGGDAPHGGEARFDQYVKKYGYDYFFAKVRAVFEADDLTIVNLEGPLTNRTKPRAHKTYTFKGKPSYVKILSGSSVEICNVANNHALDYDVAGLKDTATVLAKAGIGVSGFGKVYTTTVRGVRVSSMGFTRWQYTAKDVYKQVKAARANCDLLIVCMHWGDEGVYKASKEQRLMGRAAIEAGADVVLGSHPHVFGGIEKYKGKYIVYSLSNFCFGGNGNPSDKRTLIFRQRFAVSSKGVEDAGIDIVPTAVTLKRGGNDFQPAPMNMQRAKLLLKAIAKYSKLNGGTIKWMEGSYLVKKGLVSG